MIKKILIITGPNLNMLGKREPEIYGTTTLEDIRIECNNLIENEDISIDFRQSNHEGVIVDWLQETMDIVDAVIINAAAYTHTSIAIHDALKLHKCPIIEVHLSNPTEREDFRHVSYVGLVAKEVFAGFGAESYYKAVSYAKTVL